MSFLTFIACLNVILTSKNAYALVFSNLYPKTGGWQATRAVDRNLWYAIIEVAYLIL